MPSARKRSGSWQARWRTVQGTLTSETRRGWTKTAALKYANAMEDTARRTPWLTTSPGKAPEVIGYGQRVLATRQITEQRKVNDLAAWQNRIAPHLEGRRLTQVTPDDIRQLVAVLSTRYARA